jgi:hypothetical protein
MNTAVQGKRINQWVVCITCIVGLYIGIGGLGNQQYSDKLTFLSTQKPQIDDTIPVKLGGLPARNILEMKKLVTAEQYEKFMRFYPWMADLPDLIILLLTCCAFSLVGSHILLLRTLASTKTNSEFPGHLAMILSGFLTGLVVLGLSVLLPRVLVSEGGTIQPSALMFLSLFGGMYSDALYKKLAKYVDKLFKNG